MRCAGCAGQIPEGSQFCGVCGRSVAQARATAGGDAGPTGGGGTSAEAAALAPDGSLSLFELPVSQAARRTKIAVVLILDAILAAAGIAMILSYLDAVGRPAVQPAPAPAQRLAVALEPRLVTAADLVDGGPVDGGGQGPSGAEPARRPTDKPGRDEPRRPNAKPAVPARPGSGAGADRTAGDNVGDAGPIWDAGSTDVEAEVAQIASRMAAAVARRQGELERCYQSAAKSAGPEDRLEGRMSVRFTLLPDGSTAGARVVGDDIGSVALTTCVLDRFQSWPMPAGVSEPIELEWPFEFHAPTR